MQVLRQAKKQVRSLRAARDRPRATDLRRRTPDYHAKWAKALLDSAILMVFSRFVMASPSRRYAAMSSSARRSNIGRPALLRAAPMIQRMASDCCRDLFTCIGTWYVAPPTRLERTSTVGLTFSTAWVKTSIGLTSPRRPLILS